MICEISFQKALGDTDQGSLNSDLNIRLMILSVLEAKGSLLLLVPFLSFFAGVLCRRSSSSISYGCKIPLPCRGGSTQLGL